MLRHDRSASELPEDIICKACSRNVATTSTDGDLVPAGTQDWACDTCRPFEELHGDVKAKDEAVGEAEDYKTKALKAVDQAEGYKKKALKAVDEAEDYKQQALEAVDEAEGYKKKALKKTRAARKVFNNFLLEMEAQHTHTTSQQEPNQLPSPPQNDPTDSVEPSQQGQKRALTPSTPPEPKRRCSDNGSRRVSFDNSVFFPAETEVRPSKAFCRLGKEYMPGRNAPLEPGGFLDTSGVGMSHRSFFGGTKRSSRWMDTEDVDTEDVDTEDEDVDMEDVFTEITNENWTYGFGWKELPESPPKGIQWKAGVFDSLRMYEMREMMQRGRRYPKELRKEETVP